MDVTLVGCCIFESIDCRQKFCLISAICMVPFFAFATFYHASSIINRSTLIKNTYLCSEKKAVNRKPIGYELLQLASKLFLGQCFTYIDALQMTISGGTRETSSK